MQVIELKEDHYWGETYCGFCACQIYGTDFEEIQAHLANQHDLLPEFELSEGESLAADRLFGTFCRREFGFYRNAETEELVAVRIR